MICKICNKELKKISNTHLKLHNIPFIDYVSQNKNDFPNWNNCQICGKITKQKRTCCRECDIKFRKTLIGEKAYRYGAKLSQETKNRIKEKAIERCKNPEYIKMISDTTRNVVNKPEIKEKFINMMKNRSNDINYLTKMSNSMKNAHKEGKWEHCYTQERNDKISIGRKKWCNENKDLISEMCKKGQQTHRENIGEKEYKRRMKINAIKGIKAAMKKIGPNKFEQRLYNVLKTEDIKYIPQYEVSGKFYDAYLPEYNVLIEFDGQFWHKQTYKECIYPIQKRNLKNDKKKDWIAINNGYKLIRIKELDYITSIKKLLEQ